jgi:hypothetical protein
MKFSVFAPILALAFVCLAGCGGSDSTAPSPAVSDSGTDPLPVPDAAAVPVPAKEADAGGPDGALDAAPDAPAPACNALKNVGELVTIQALASDPPAPEGGALADGTYVATSAVLYTGSGGASGPTTQTTQLTIQIDGSHVETVIEGERSSATFATSGTRITSTTTCPDRVVQENGYSATATSFLVFIPRAGGKMLVETLTRL